MQAGGGRLGTGGTAGCRAGLVAQQLVSRRLPTLAAAVLALLPCAISTRPQPLSASAHMVRLVAPGGCEGDIHDLTKEGGLRCGIQCHYGVLALRAGVVVAAPGVEEDGRGGGVGRRRGVGAWRHQLHPVVAAGRGGRRGGRCVRVLLATRCTLQLLAKWLSACLKSSSLEVPSSPTWHHSAGPCSFSASGQVAAAAPSPPLQAPTPHLLPSITGRTPTHAGTHVWLRESKRRLLGHVPVDQTCWL